MQQTGIVREWHAGEGWGVIDAPDVPGGCWAHFSAVVSDGYRGLEAGQTVTFIAESAQQDGYHYRAVQVGAGSLPKPGTASEAFSSTLRLDFD